MKTIRDLLALRIAAPPFTKDPALNGWLRDAHDALNALPNISTFSYATPESNVTAHAPALGFNVASNVSGLWFKQTGSGNTGWTAIA